MESAAHVTDLLSTANALSASATSAAASRVGWMQNLILACNGFAGNSALVAKYLPDVRGLPFAGHEGSQRCACMGIALEAQLAEIDGFWRIAR